MSSGYDEQRFRAVIEEKVAEGISDPLPSLMPRDLSLGEPQKPAPGNLVNIVAGVRRCGKTYRLFQEMRALEDSGVPRDHMLYFNLNDERLKPYDARQLDAMLNAYLLARPDARSAGTYFFLDEIQEVPDWGAFLRRLVDTWSATIYVTGSSSRMLSSEMPSEFRGRSITRELFPMSFSEFCRSRGFSPAPGHVPRTQDEQALLRRTLDEYLVRGGFIAAQSLPRPEAFQLLQGYAGQTVSQDIVERYGIRNARAASAFVARCIASSARELSLSRVSGQMKQAGISVSRETLASLLGYYEESYLVFSVREMSRALSDNPRSSSKVYAVDPGLEAAYSPATSEDAAQRLETSVFDALRRRAGFLRKGTISRLLVESRGKRCEVDFAVGDALLEEPVAPIQVSASLLDEMTRKRELSTLAAGMRRLGCKEGTVVTLDEREEISLPEGTVHVVPAWEWLLD